MSATLNAEQLFIKGGVPLVGEVRIAGAKNAALPLLAATLLTEDEMRLSNCPCLQDVATMLWLLRTLGIKVSQQQAEAKVYIGVGVASSHLAPDHLVRIMRASFLVLGPLLATTGQARISLPGGCAIGTRPVDQHLAGFAAMGADIRIEDGYVIAAAPAGLTGANILLNVPTVTGTENILMAATLAKGRTVIKNAACEPEVVDLANCLIAMGADIQGQGSSTLIVEGVDRLHGVSYQIISDRIESGSYLVAAAATGGSIRVVNTQPEHMEAVVAKLAETGARIDVQKDSIGLDMRGRRPKAVGIKTAPYPGFPSDMQAQFTALNAIAAGTSQIEENMFENRLMHVQQLKRMGADIAMQGASSVGISGVSKLQAASVMATDLRASFGLVIAALAAEGETCIDRIYHIDRGYERLEEKLSALGAHVFRREASEQRQRLSRASS